MRAKDLFEKSTSQAQFRTMAAAANNPKFAKKVGISQDVAREFHAADRKSDYKKLPDHANESQLNELFDADQQYFKLADGQVIRADFTQAGLNPDGMSSSIKISTVDPKIMPSAATTAVQPWDKARPNIRAAIQKWVQGGQQDVSEAAIAEDLRKWFKEKWVRFGPDGKIRGDCARGSSSEGKPKCLPQSKAQSLGKKGRASAAAKKRREDPDPERRGAAKNVATKVKEQDITEKWSKKYKSSINCSHPKGFSQKAHCAGKKKHNEDITMEMTCPDCNMCETHGNHSHANLDEACWKGYHKEGNKELFGKTVPNCVKNEAVEESHEMCPGCGGAMYPDSMILEKQDACYYKVKSRYKVWPSAYASGALVQCRKKGAKNWGNKNEAANPAQQAAIAIAMKKAGQKPKSQGVAEAGPFSYGSKAPRKGSVADLAAKKHKEQQKGKQPVEPKDQMVGVAKVITKGVAEGYKPSAGELARDLIKLADDDFNKKYGMSKQQANQYYSSSKLKEQGVAEGSNDWSGPLYDPALQGNGKKQRYEMMFKNGQVKRFSAMNDNEARKIAAGHGAKSFIRMKGNVPGDKIKEQGVAESSESLSQWEDRMKKLGYKITKNNKTATYHAWEGTTHKDSHKARGVAEGKMAELDMDLEDPEISDRQFEKMYGMTRKEARELFSKTNMWDFPQVRDPNKPLHEQGVAEGAPELLKKVMPLHRHAEKLLAQNGVSKDDPDYHHHLGNTIKHLRQFGNIDLINKSDEQGVAEARGKDQDQFGGMHQDDFQEKLMRLKSLAGAGPMKTVYDPNKRVYKNMPTAVQPPRQPKK